MLLQSSAASPAGWGVLGPIAKARGWAPGPIKDAQTGAAGWLLWVSLGLLLGDCFSELGLLLLQTAVDKASQSDWMQRVGLNGGLGLRGGFSNGKGDSGNGKNSRWQAAAGDYARLRVIDPEQGLAAGGLGFDSNLNFSSNGYAAGSRSVLEMSPTGSANGLSEPDSGIENPAGTNNGVSNNSNSWQMDRQQQQQLGSSVSWAAGSRNAANDNQNAESNRHDDAGSSRDSGGWMLTAKFWLPGLLLSTALCSGILGPLLPLGMPVYEPLIAVSRPHVSGHIFFCFLSSGTIANGSMLALVR
jgi:hypothetical protein